MTYGHVSLRGTGKSFEMVDAFLAIAEAGGSMQARFARQELSKLTVAEKTALDESLYRWAFHEKVNGALANALNVCNEHWKKNPGEGMVYGCDIRIINVPVSSVWAGGSWYQFFWTAHEYSPCVGDFEPTRYVVVSLNRADSEVELTGRASDVVELFNRSRVAEIIPKWSSYKFVKLDNGKIKGGDFCRISMSRIAKGRVVRMPRKKQVA